MQSNDIFSALKKYAHQFHPVIPFDNGKDKLIALDLSKTNTTFTEGIYGTTEIFSRYIDHLRKNSNATYLIGGYRESREMYRRSNLFDKNLVETFEHAIEPRSLHLGTDIWGKAGTTVFAPVGGMVESFAFNNNYGDYGATIILQHQLETFNFYSLYGHLALNDIIKLRKGQFISRGEPFAHFGEPAENGNWPPHLHFQLIIDIWNYDGDYPGVCKMSEADKYLKNSPDPDLLLQLNQYISR